MKNELDLIQNKLEEKGLLSEEVKNHLFSVDECVKDILAQRFGEAQRKLILINDDNEVINVVKNVYNNLEDNFDIVIKLADYVNDEKTSFLIYSTLNGEMEKNRQNSTLRLAKIVKDLRRKFIDLDNISLDIKKEATKKESSIISRIKEVAVIELEASSLQYNHSSTKELADELLDLNYDLLADTITRFIHNVYSKIGTDKLVYHIRDYESIEQRILSFVALFNELENSKQLDGNPALLRLVKYLSKEERNVDNYSKPTNIKTEYQTLKNKLPKSIKNVVYSPSVCIKNVFLNEYLYAADFYHNNDSAVGRYLFTWVPGGRGNYGLHQSLWSFNGDYINGDFYLKNAQFSHYAFASDVEVGPKKRLAFATILKDPVQLFSWVIIPQGDNVYLKNFQLSEYLVTDGSTKRDPERRFVYTEKLDKPTPEAEWKIETCRY